VVNSLPGEVEAAERLKQTALRDFGRLLENDDQRGATTYRLAVSPDDAPVPALLKFDR
jgi:hypothetical protein